MESNMILLVNGIRRMVQFTMVFFSMQIQMDMASLEMMKMNQDHLKQVFIKQLMENMASMAMA